MSVFMFSWVPLQVSLDDKTQLVKIANLCRPAR